MLLGLHRLQLLVLVRGREGVVGGCGGQLADNVRRLFSAQRASQVLVRSEASVVRQLRDRRLAHLDALGQVVDVRLDALNVLISAGVIVVRLQSAEQSQIRLSILKISLQFPAKEVCLVNAK